MAQTFITGKLTLVEPVETKESYSSQRIEVTVLEFDSTTGQPKEPQVFPLIIFNKKITELAASTKVGQQVMVKAYLRSIKSEKETKTFYNVGLNVAELKTI